ncbi:OsmC family protein [Arenimonas sp. MALMAid1274]|uniref:OsmC family protein n=1 Tax=Arenimonas sp. MALMAid1274 TaxID=3411630 RepID=UPI003BA14062
MSARPAHARIGETYPPYATQLVVGAHHWVADEPADLGGTDSGPAPDEVLLAALASCTAITLRMYAQRKQWPLDGVEVDVAYAERGKDRTVLQRTVHLHGPLDDTQRERLLQVANACPVHKILTGQVEVPTALA